MLEKPAPSLSGARLSLLSAACWVQLLHTFKISLTKRTDFRTVFYMKTDNRSCHQMTKNFQIKPDNLKKQNACKEIHKYGFNT